MPDTYELATKVAGVKARHIDRCNAREGKRCVCKDRLRYVARAWDPEARDGQGGTVAKTFRERSHAEEWKSEMDRRRRAGATLSPGMKGFTMDDLVERFARDARDGRILNRRRVNYSVQSIRGIEEIGRNGWPLLREREVRTITEANVAELAGDLMAAGRSASRVRNVINTMRLLLAYADSTDIIPASPRTDRLKLPKLPSSSSKRAPKVTLAVRLLQAVPEADRVAWALFAFAGARLMEGLWITVEDVDFDRGLIHVPGTKSDHADRWAPLIKPLRDEIRAHMLRTSVRTGLLLPPRYAGNQRGHVSPEWLREHAYAAWDAAGMPRYEPHEFRHGYDTWLMRAGVSDQVRRVIVGHGRDSLDATYVHVGKSDLRAAGRLLEQHIEQQSEQRDSHQQSHKTQNSQ
ncbi:unannotated protein [freshwater metagenome]|uniref:Unannotated protein n=1 Tax=freshwater metagenome TaxID=449393 RepID=A0A6J7FKB8_9ZZZZ|nr:tyrosine-type recombinase/integrase [Actinomycetota bacterium]